MVQSQISKSKYVTGKGGRKNKNNSNNNNMK